MTTYLVDILLHEIGGHVKYAVGEEGEPIAVRAEGRRYFALNIATKILAYGQLHEPLLLQKLGFRRYAMEANPGLRKVLDTLPGLSTQARQRLIEAIANVVEGLGNAQQSHARSLDPTKRPLPITPQENPVVHSVWETEAAADALMGNIDSSEPSRANAILDQRAALKDPTNPLWDLFNADAQFLNSLGTLAPELVAIARRRAQFNDAIAKAKASLDALREFEAKLNADGQGLAALTAGQSAMLLNAYKKPWKFSGRSAYLRTISKSAL